MTLTRYVRRSTPPFDAGWFDAEHIAIQRALNSVEDAVDAFPAPSATTTSGHLTADGATGSGFATVGLSFPVAIGESWTARWNLWIQGQSSGLLVQVTYPSTAKALGRFFGIGATNAAFQADTSSVSPLASLLTYANGNFSTTDGWLTVDVAFDGCSANGAVDLQVRKVSGLEGYSIRRASSLVAVKT